MSEVYSERKGWHMIDDVKDLAAALANVQRNVEHAKKENFNPHFKSNYADLATIWNVIREPLTSEGLSVLQLPCEAPAGQIGLVTHILHKSGQSISEHYYCGLKDPSNPQQVGSALTYMKRYALMGVAGIASEDDDGNAAAGKPSPASPVVDYSATVAEAMTNLTKALEANDEMSARALYATVNNSTISEPTKSELLKRMADTIKAHKSPAKKEAKK